MILPEEITLIFDVVNVHIDIMYAKNLDCGGSLVGFWVMC